MLYQDVRGQVPEPKDAVSYASVIGDPDFPVTVDQTGAMLTATPWDASALPGKCTLSPEMKLLDCYVGDEDDHAFDVIAEDWAARP